ncbi:PqqD family peptide modification chaperone [uncultured Roseobacter sp.]|uniref:PqqD family peptide modification chaperone n=1 Tax=uncultured Roseobacter sp. TaxID=114847 RepID=UPI002634252E|nr:PqqD family peptide modification chaperone [uncultured Roseobacter sp.]
MSESYLSTIWYRVENLAPRLQSQVTVHRHRYRGQPWYVLHDHATGRVHRFTPGAYMIIGQFDGTRTINDIWNNLADTYDEDAPSQDDVIQLLSTLHQNDLMLYRSSPDVADLLERHNRMARQVIKQNMMNPMSFRVPLWDPDAFLTKTLPAVRWLLGGWGILLWLLVVTAGGIAAAMNWQQLTADLSGQLFSTQNLLITLVSYPLLKALHELAHGYLAKQHGGEIREMGIMFLVFFPVPYVDASSAAAFRNKWHRAAVSAGGIIVETFAAAVAVFIWLDAEPGLTRAIAYNVIMIGGLSTILVNGNPLLKFDGYYVLADIIEIPNFSTRANKFYGHVIQRKLFGAKQMKPFNATTGERIWFLIYAPAAFIYRMIIMVGIALFVAGKFFFIGVLIACWSLFSSLIKPSIKHLYHVVTSPQLRKVRKRANIMTFGVIAFLIAVSALIPLPLRTDSEGVVWLPDNAYVRAGAPGFVSEINVARGAQVSPGETLGTLEDPSIRSRLELVEWRVEEQRRRLMAAEASSLVQADEIRASLASVEGELAREQTRFAKMNISAEIAGTFEPAQKPENLKGRFLNQGDLLGYVLPNQPDTIRVAFRQQDEALIKTRLKAVEVKLAGHLETTIETEGLRHIPSATDQLPSPALGQGAGGPFQVNPGDENGAQSLERFFMLDLYAPDDLASAAFGTRVFVRFDHGYEPAAFQAFRRARQLFLRRFGA